jgi:hypothetical protein
MTAPVANVLRHGAGSAPAWLGAGPRRSGRRVALLARYPDRDPAMPQFIPNLGLYMVEAALRAARLPGLEIQGVGRHWRRCRYDR